MNLTEHRRSWGERPAPRAVRGVRFFTPIRDYLVGQWHQQWLPGENIAQCVLPREGRLSKMHYHEPHEVPDDRCSDGFYSYWSLADLPEYQQTKQVVGVIDGYGAVLLGEKGFRAQKARLVAIAPGFKFWGELQTLAEIARRYDVPVFGSVSELLEAFPPRRPDDEDHSS